MIRDNRKVVTMESMMKIMKKNKQGFGLVFLALILFVSCDRDRNNPGWDFFPDMFYSNAYETNSENPVFEDGLTQRLPVDGTIPRDVIPFDYPNTKEGMEQAGLDMKNPYENTAENLERGKEIYQRFCISCHGEKGDGKGFLHTSRKYVYPPASLLSKKMKKKPDGEIYHSITLGYGIMGAHGSQLRPRDRWKLILYIRNGIQK